MQVTVKRWGNSAAVRIPTSVLGAAKLRLDQQVDVREDDGRIIIEAIVPEACDIEALVAGITDENLHGFIETGPPVGNEVW